MPLTRDLQQAQIVRAVFLRMSKRPEDVPPEFRDERSIPQPQVEQLQIEPPEPLPVEEVEKKPDEKIDPFLRQG